jgi:hypothetical protein
MPPVDPALELLAVPFVPAVPLELEPLVVPLEAIDELEPVVPPVPLELELELEFEFALEPEPVVPEVLALDEPVELEWP